MGSLPARFHSHQGTAGRRNNADAANTTGCWLCVRARVCGCECMNEVPPLFLCVCALTRRLWLVVAAGFNKRTRTKLPLRTQPHMLLYVNTTRLAQQSGRAVVPQHLPHHEALVQPLALVRPRALVQLLMPFLQPIESSWTPTHLYVGPPQQPPCGATGGTLTDECLWCSGSRRATGTTKRKLVTVCRCWVSRV